MKHEAYLRWLAPQVVQPPKVARSDLLHILHAKPFNWTIHFDHNRVVDGLDLRIEFLGYQDVNLELGPCSFLEVLIGLSRKLSFAGGGEPGDWAWQLLKNLDLHRLVDPVSRRKADLIDEIMERVIWRTYSADGVGGFFPLAWPKEDQRYVELWYQMSAYLEEDFQL